MFFTFEIENNWVQQQFYCQAEDLISAHMKAMEFAALLQQKTKERYGEELLTKVSSVGEWLISGMDTEAIETFLDSLKDYLMVEE